MTGAHKNQARPHDAIWGGCMVCFRRFGATALPFCMRKRKWFILFRFFLLLRCSTYIIDTKFIYTVEKYRQNRKFSLHKERKIDWQYFFCPIPFSLFLSFYSSSVIGIFLSFLPSFIIIFQLLIKYATICSHQIA